MRLKHLSASILLLSISFEFAKVPINCIETVALGASNIALYGARHKMEKYPNSNKSMEKWGATKLDKDLLGSLRDCKFVKSLLTNPFFHISTYHLLSNLTALTSLTALNYSANNKESYILPYVFMGALSNLIKHKTMRTELKGDFFAGASNCILGVMIYSLYNFVKKLPESFNIFSAVLAASSVCDLKFSYNNHYGVIESAIIYILGEEVFYNLYKQSPTAAYGSLIPMLAILTLYIGASNNKTTSGSFINLVKKLPVLNLFFHRRKTPAQYICK